MDIYNNETAQPVLKDLQDWTYNEGLKKVCFPKFQSGSWIYSWVVWQKSKVIILNCLMYNKVNIRLSTHDADGVG
jgi:4a-hydroxytetrahydrobiopterin dehydratase